MRSLIDIEIGKASRDDYMVHIPVGMHVSDDDSADEKQMPNVSFTWFTMLLSHETVLKGKEAILDRANDLLKDHIRFEYSGAGYAKMRDALYAYLETTDLTKLAVGWFPNPTSRTLH